MPNYEINSELWEDSAALSESGLTITRKRIVVSDSRSVTALDVLSSFGLEIGSIGPNNTILSALAVNRTNTKSTDNTYEVVYTYEPNQDPDDGSSGGGGVPNTIQKNRSIRIGYGNDTIPFEKDRNGVPILNSARQKFRNLPLIEKAYDVLTLSDRVSYNRLNLDLLSLYRNKINNAIFFGFGVEKVKLINYGANSGFDNGVPYLDISLDFAVKDSWDINILDTGRVESVEPLAAVGGESAGAGFAFAVKAVRNVIDNNGLPVAEDVPFNGKGQKLKQGENLVFINFKPFQTVNFVQLLNSLGMPTNVAGYG